MASDNIALLRLQQLHVSQPAASATAVVTSLGAVQAQDYAAAKWSLGLRMPATTDAGIEKAFADRQLVRSWVLRSTLHIVAAADLHWMLDLLSDRLINQHAGYYKKEGLDQQTLRKSQQILQRALEGGEQLTRPELATILEKKGVALGEMRLNFILVRAAIDKIICHGERRGNAFTYTLLDEWIKPPKARLPYDEALAKLALRYFTGHGPATSKDFAWWAGLTGGEAKRGLEMVADQLECITTGEEQYWMQPGIVLNAPKAKGIFLLPSFDEFLLGYTDRSATMDEAAFKRVVYTKNGLFNPTIVINGRIAGTWRRTFKKDEVHIDIMPFETMSSARLSAIAKEARRYAKFMECKPVLPFLAP